MQTSCPLHRTFFIVSSVFALALLIGLVWGVVHCIHETWEKERGCRTLCAESDTPPIDGTEASLDSFLWDDSGIGFVQGFNCVVHVGEGYQAELLAMAGFDYLKKVRYIQN